MTVTNAGTNRKRDQALSILRARKEKDELDQLRLENDAFRAQLGLAKRERKGRLPTRKGTETYALKRAKGLLKKAGCGKDSREFIQQLADDGISAGELRALLGVIHETAYALMASEELEPRFALGAAQKAIETMIKLREVEAMEAVEVEGHIHVTMPVLVQQEAELRDVTPRGTE